MRRHDWGYHHEPTRGHIPFAFPRGKVVGGSSAVNTCIALRGQPYDFDEWASMGLADWSFDRCLPAFKRLERDLDIDNSWHGQTGPIPIRRHPDHELSHWQRAFMQACASLGFERCEDTNNPDTTGFGPHAMNKVNGVRMSASRCYLTPEVRARESLTIRARTRVDRVNITNRRVTGLHVQTEGRAYTIAAKKVVLSAGAIATPGILLRSGIGARHMLERFGVDVVSDLPAVGARLLDHPGLAIFLRPYERPDFSEPLIQTVLRFTSRDSPYRNDVQIQPGTFVPFSRITLPLVSVMCAIGKPRSTGRLIYASAHPERDAARIHSDFFEDPRDRQMAVEAIGLAWQVRIDGAHARTRATVLADATHAGEPGCDRTRAAEDLRIGLPPMRYRADGTRGGSRRGGRRARSGARRRRTACRGRERDADDPEREYEPHDADDRRALRRMAARWSGVSTWRHLRGFVSEPEGQTLQYRLEWTPTRQRAAGRRRARVGVERSR